MRNAANLEKEVVIIGVGSRLEIWDKSIWEKCDEDISADEIAENIRQCIADAADNPCGYNLCPGCTTPVGTSKENMIAFMNAAAIYGKGARKGQMPKGMKKYV